MTPLDRHAMLAIPNHDETCRQDFVNDFRLHLSNEVAPGCHPTYRLRVLPPFVKEHGREPKDDREVRQVMTEDPYYQMWSAMQRSSQEMVWDSVTDTVERQLPELIAKARQPGNKGSLTLDPDLEIPSYLTAKDIHLQPGAYHTDSAADDVAAGAVYDRGTYIYSMGGLGTGNDGLGQLGFGFFKSEFLDAKPERILDMGCTIGGSGVYWAQQMPGVEFHAIDVGAPVLRYGHARAESLGVAVHFSQQNAEHTNFEDESFDVVTSHILLHETSRKAIQNLFNESYRLLKPGGIMMHMDLPQFQDDPPLERFLSAWEIYNNNEHFYGQLREMDLIDVCQKAGFKDENIHSKLTRSIWEDDHSPYVDEEFRLPVTVGIK